MRHLPLLVLVGLPILAACDTRPAPRPVAVLAAPVAPAPAAIDVSPPGIDGRYGGTAILADGSDPNCRPRNIAATMTVNRGRAALALARLGRAEGTILSDSTIGFNGLGFAANGRFNGAVLTGDVSREACIYLLTLRRRGP